MSLALILKPDNNLRHVLMTTEKTMPQILRSTALKKVTTVQIKIKTSKQSKALGALARKQCGSGCRVTGSPK